jgi:hypothetical protein
MKEFRIHLVFALLALDEPILRRVLAGACCN